MELILDTTDTESSVFTAVGVWGFYLTTNGGTWQVQTQDPDGNWATPPQTEYKSSGPYEYPGIPGIPLRFQGGTVGAKIWVWGVTVL